MSRTSRKTAARGDGRTRVEARSLAPTCGCRPGRCRRVAGRRRDAAPRRAVDATRERAARVAADRTRCALRTASPARRSAACRTRHQRDARAPRAGSGKRRRRPGGVTRRRVHQQFPARARIEVGTGAGGLECHERADRVRRPAAVCRRTFERATIDAKALEILQRQVQAPAGKVVAQVQEMVRERNPGADQASSAVGFWRRSSVDRVRPCPNARVDQLDVALELRVRREVIERDVARDPSR